MMLGHTLFCSHERRRVFKELSLSIKRLQRRRLLPARVLTPGSFLLPMLLDGTSYASIFGSAVHSFSRILLAIATFATPGGHRKPGGRLPTNPLETWHWRCPRQSRQFSISSREQLLGETQNVSVPQLAETQCFIYASLVGLRCDGLMKVQRPIKDMTSRQPEHKSTHAYQLLRTSVSTLFFVPDGFAPRSCHPSFMIRCPLMLCTVVLLFPSRQGLGSAKPAMLMSVARYSLMYGVHVNS